MSEDTAPTGAQAILGDDTATAPTPQATEAPTNTETPTNTDAPAAPAAEAFDWSNHLEGDLLAHAQTKGYADIAAAVKGQLNAEKLLGVPADRLLRLPADPADAEGMGEIYARLGKPESADGYQLGDNVGEEAGQWMRDTFHGANLTEAQATSLTEALVARETATEEAAETQAHEQSQRELGEVKAEWGQEYDNNVVKAQRGQKLLEESGIDPGARDAIERAIGTKGLLNMLAKLGSRTSEDTFISGRSENALGLTPEIARSKLAQLHGDPKFSQRLMSNDVAVSSAAAAEQKKLLAAMSR